MDLTTIYYIPSGRNFILNILVKSQLERYQSWINKYCYSVPYRIVYADQISNAAGAKFIAFDPLSTKRIESSVCFFTAFNSLKQIVLELHLRSLGVRGYMWELLSDTLPMAYYEGIKRYTDLNYDCLRFSVDDIQDKCPTSNKRNTIQQKKEPPFDLEIV